jgi:hypothetical protein
MTRGRKGWPLLALALLVMALAGSTQAAPKDSDKHAAKIKTKSDAAKAKLDAKLQDKVESGSTDVVTVFATVQGSAEAAKSLMQDAAATIGDDGPALVVGKIGANRLLKLAGAQGVLSVKLVELKQTAAPPVVPDSGVGRKAGNKTAHQIFKKDVPYSEAPPPIGSRFEQMKSIAALDAKTHDFVGAWGKGYAGEGSTVGVLDGGTDFGHPDLLGTWEVWSGATDTATTDDGWNGWPKAFDPYGTLVWLLAPDFIPKNLTFYAPTQAVECPGGPRTRGSCVIKFETRLGPSRNFDAPDALSKKHNYHLPAVWSKSGVVRMGSHPDDYLLSTYGERPAFVVTDPNTAGVYDTVYVDLDADYSFEDEKPVSKSSPASYRDVNADGYTDISGGLLYFISDGQTKLSGGLARFLGPDTPVFAPGEMTAWSGDYDPGIGGHGTLTASNVVAQAVANGNLPTFTDLPGGKLPGAVIGGAPKAKLTPFSDIYFSFSFSTQFGYLLTTRHGVDITSNSYGESAVDNDGWDAASQEADILHAGSRTSFISSTGNGAPGYGTTTPPSPTAGISVGASTQFGGTGWDSIARLSQVVDDDVMVWSNRGPGATATTGVDVVADGAFSAGDVTLNAVFDGRFAWATWGGTSRSTPVAAAASALVYQAYRAKNPGALPAGFYDTVKRILKSSAEDLGYDSFVQGAGSVDASTAVDVAAGTRASVSPDEWRVGSQPDGAPERRVFPNLIAPGGTDTQPFTINGPGTWNVSDRQLTRYDSETFELSSKNVAEESGPTFNAPDYLLDLTSRVNAHADADLMIVRLNFPRAQFDGNADLDEDQAWRLNTYSWTDINGDGNLWTDTSSDGVVDYQTLPQTNIDGNPLISPASEIDPGEYVRFMYHRAGSNALMSFLRDPKARMASGIFLGLQHSARNPAIPVTNFEVQIDWYKNVDWSWLTTPATATGSFSVTANVPADAPYGMYEGAIVLEQSGDTMVVPVVVGVTATATQDAAGKLTGTVKFGGPAVAAAQANLPYNNGTVFGANDWTWRAESGDWRFDFLNVPIAPPAGTLFLASTTWDDPDTLTDIDTLILGRSANSYQLLPGTAPFGAPYILDLVGGSPNRHIGSGVWEFDTATGENADLVTAPVQQGLHEFLFHQVSWDGGKFHVPFETTVGAASVSPASVAVTTTTGAGAFDVTFESNLPLDGLRVEGFGLSQPSTTTETASQDDPNDPSTASVKKSVTISHASRAVFETHLNQDIDLFVVKDGEIVAASAGATGDERVELIRPEDGTYEVWVHGFAIAGNPTFPLLIDIIQGTDLVVTAPSGPVPANTPVTIHATFNKPTLPTGDSFGEILLGPPAAPAAITVPVKVTRP